MNTAQHSTTNEIYSANQIEKMDSLTRNSIRKHLQCEECKERAFFRNKSRNGRTACFFAEHKADCGLGNSKKSNGEATGKKEDHKKESDSDIFGIKWNDLFELITDETKSDLIEAFNRKGQSHTEYTKNPAKKTMSNLTLAKILHYAKNKILAKQEFKIILHDKAERLQDIVFHAHYLKGLHVGKVGLYWGYLNSTDNINWLNIDKNSPYNRFSIQLHQDIREVFWKRMGKIKNWTNSVPFIVFGRLQISESGKLFVVVRNTFEIYIDKSEYNKNKVKDG